MHRLMIRQASDNIYELVANCNIIKQRVVKMQIDAVGSKLNAKLLEGKFVNTEDKEGSHKDNPFVYLSGTAFVACRSVSKFIDHNDDNFALIASRLALVVCRQKNAKNLLFAFISLFLSTTKFRLMR